MAWQIDYSESAQRQLARIDKQAARRIMDFMDQRVAPQANPRQIGKALKGPRLDAYWRYRIGDYRIICEIQDQVLRVLVIQIGHRPGRLAYLR